MLVKAKALADFKMQCRDGLFGRVREFYFDDLHWTIRYLVAETSAEPPPRASVVGSAARNARSSGESAAFTARSACTNGRIGFT